MREASHTKEFLYIAVLLKIAVNIYIDWVFRNYMPCNLPKCNELAILKKNVLSSNFMPVGGNKQLRSLKILGITSQNNGRFLEHIRLNPIPPGLFWSSWAWGGGGGGFKSPPT